MFAFVILHYCALLETIQCIESIENKFDLEDYLIVVVDNASPNGTGKELLEKYQNDSRCHIILNDNNLGFAKGNNVGFVYAKKQGAKFICMMNSDTCILNDDFGRQIIADYHNYHFYVLGPNIILKRPEIRVNPMGEHVMQIEEVKKHIISLRIQYIMCFLGLGKAVDWIRYRKEKQSVSSQRYERELYYENVKLHGCCLIFSEDYIEKYEGLNPDTFLYLEEDLLFLEMMRKQNLMLYSPKVKIYHAEDGSSNYMYRGRQKKLFVLKNHLNSMKAIRKSILEFKD